MKPFLYVCYRVWRWKERNPREDFPLLVAMLAVTVLLSFNVFGAVMFAEYFARARWLEGLTRSQISSGALLIGSAIFLVLQLSWIRNGSFHVAAQEFAHEDYGARRRHTVFIWAYIALTIATPIIAIILHRLSA